MIKFYYTYVNDLDITKYKSSLSEQRLSSIIQYKNLIDAKRSAACELLLIKSLKDDCLYPIIKYKYNSLGKPSLESYPNYFFNYSHSKDISACVTSNSEVGLDIETNRDLEEEKIKRLSSRLMNEKQIKDIFDSNYNEKFFKYWVIKESYSKLLGIGIGICFNKVNICEDKNLVWLDEDKKANFYFFNIDDYSVCITSFDKIKLKIHKEIF